MNYLSQSILNYTLIHHIKTIYPFPHLDPSIKDTHREGSRKENSSQLLITAMMEGTAESELGGAEAAAGLLHVAVEALGGHLDLLEEGAVEHGRRGPLRPLARRRLRRLRELVVRQARRDLERVADLSPVPAPCRSRVVLAVRRGGLMLASLIVLCVCVGGWAGSGLTSASRQSLGHRRP